MFPQVSAKCLRRQSSVSTAVCIRACVFLFCLVRGLETDFFFFFGLTKKANKGSCPWWWNRGCQGRLQHVLSLQRMAGGLSAHREPLNHPLFLCMLMEQFHVRIALWSDLFISILFDFDWRGWLRRVGKAKCNVGLKVDLTGYWTIWWLHIDQSWGLITLYWRLLFIPLRWLWTGGHQPLSSVFLYFLFFTVNNR